MRCCQRQGHGPRSAPLDLVPVQWQRRRRAAGRHSCDPPAPARGAVPRCARSVSPVTAGSCGAGPRCEACAWPVPLRDLARFKIKFMTYPSLIQNLAAYISIFSKASSFIFYFPPHLKMATRRGVFLSHCDEVSADAPCLSPRGACLPSSPQRPLS